MDDSPISPGRLAQRHALVIDDEEEIASLIAESLNRSGYTVTLPRMAALGRP